MKITFVRHGQTENNVSQILISQTDGDLTEIGKEEAKKLGEKLKEEKFDIIYCSDSKRTKDTAKEILKYHKETPIIYTAELREIHRGNMIGKHGKEFHKAYLNSGIGFADFKPEGGESINELKKRIEKFLNILYKKHRGKHILLITHGGVCRSIWDICNNEEPSEKNLSKAKPDNSCIGIAELKNNKLELLVYNSTEHLK